MQADKAQRDNTIRDLEQELSEVSELSSRLNKEKKSGPCHRLIGRYTAPMVLMAFVVVPRVICL